MGETLRKLKMKYTLVTTAVLGLFLFLMLGIFFLLHFATVELTAGKILDAALTMQQPDSEILGGRRCFTFITVYDESGGSVFIMDTDDPEIGYYGDKAHEIIEKAAAAGSGNFSVDEMYFRVKSNENKDGSVRFAVYDRTTDRKQMVSSALILSMLYIVSLAMIAVICNLFTSHTLNPVEESFRKQRDLITNASHELKTPLTIISSNLAVIKSEPASTISDNAEWIASINTQIDRMNGLIQSMLELSKMEHDTQLERELVDMSGVTEGACLAFEAVCFEKGVTITSDIDKDVSVIGSHSALERLVIILLDNAVKYCGDNGRIGCMLKKNSKKMMLTVLNTGSVISEENAKHVFDRFYRADGARSNSDNRSFGLGLAIAHATVAEHGGSITCKGIPGKGTFFVVTLPLPKKSEKALVCAKPKK